MAHVEQCADSWVLLHISDCVQISCVFILLSVDMALDCQCAEHMHSTLVAIWPWRPCRE